MTVTKLVEFRGDGAEFFVGRETELADAGHFIGFATFAPGGDLVITSALAAGSGSSLYATDGVLVHRFEESFIAPISWGFSPDGTLLFAGDISGVITVFDVEALRRGSTSKEAMRLRIVAHKGNTGADQMSSDGAMIASTARNEPAKVWDAESGRLLAEFGSGEGNVSIAFHPSKPSVFVDEDGLITTHTLDTEELLAAARSSVTRNLTDAECERFLRRSCDA